MYYTLNKLYFQIKIYFAKIIIINGPSCVGKSTVIDLLFKLKKDIFLLKYDSVKRFFIDYKYENDFDKVINLLTTIAKDRIQKGEDILVKIYLFLI